MKPIPPKEISMPIICLSIRETSKYKRVERLREPKISVFHWLTSFKQISGNHLGFVNEITPVRTRSRNVGKNVSASTSFPSLYAAHIAPYEPYKMIRRNCVEKCESRK